jgi:NAD(P)-dependent dehydrogenase (short-subunit alcohol dehydrogenase family)
MSNDRSQRTVGRLAGKRIIVTGGAQGIGEATVRAYAAQGATVYSLDVKAERGELVAREATDAGSGTVTFLLADVSDRTAVDAAFGQAHEAMGGLDVRSTSRGIQRFADVDDLSQDVLEFFFRINVFGTMYTNGIAYRLMKSAGSGAIVSFGSESGLNWELKSSVYG